MATTIRPEISKRNKYYIDKHRHYELKHFCLQYPAWKREHSINKHSSDIIAESKALYSIGASDNAKFKMDTVDERIELIERASKEADCDLHQYILKAITEGLSYTYLKTRMNIPCSRDTYYDRYRRFFWILDKLRD